ncbi:hypothetical protein MTO96_011960 [Rhipicephalus appendiculatus]
MRARVARTNGRRRTAHPRSARGFGVRTPVPEGVLQPKGDGWGHCNYTFVKDASLSFFADRVADLAVSTNVTKKILLWSHAPDSRAYMASGNCGAEEPACCCA